MKCKTIAILGLALACAAPVYADSASPAECVQLGTLAKNITQDRDEGVPADTLKRSLPSAKVVGSDLRAFGIMLIDRIYSTEQTGRTPTDIAADVEQGCMEGAER